MDVTDFTKSARTVHAIADLQHFWKSKGEDGHPVSDIVDDEGRQYVDLVMEGGGVLGVALLGYVYALESVNIRFLGVGGTSAGAIVSTLIAALATAENPKSELALHHLAELNMFDFVDGDKDVQDFVKAIARQAGRTKLFWKAFQVLDNIHDDNGLNPGVTFLNWTERVLNEAGIKTVADLNRRFSDLPVGLRTRTGQLLDKEEAAAGLKIVAGDITTETKAVFPEMADLYFKEPNKVNPARFVRASMSIPLFFQPYRVGRLPKGEAALQRWGNVGYKGKIPSEIVFADGGIMSNFPIDLFHEPGAKKVPLAPTLGARLGRERDQPNKTDKTYRYLLSVFNAARHCNDYDFLARHPDYRHLVTYIPTGEHNWLNFFMDSDDKVDLFERGVEAAALFLRTFDWDGYKDVRKAMVDSSI